MLLSLALFCTAVILSTSAVPIQDSKDVFPGVGEYLFDGAPRNWSEAFNFCTENNGHLAVINSEAEKVALRTMMAKNGVSSIHLGFHDKYKQGNFVTVKNDPIESGCSGASQWATGYPKGGSTSYTCGGFTAAGIVDKECDVKEATICELNPSASYDLIPGFGYYKNHTEWITWFEAWEVCRSEGGYLHILNSAAERDVLYEKYEPKNFCWTGVHRLHATANDQFVTIFNEPFSSTGFNEWYGTGPSGTFLTAPVVAMIYPVGLATGLGTTVSSFICEMDL